MRDYLKEVSRILLRAVTPVFLICGMAYGWGSTGHRIINLKAPMHLPESMSDLKKDSLFYRSYASAPDYRKDYSDTSFFSEEKRHYIDIDLYPGFKTIPHNLDSMIALYGRSYVHETGTLPWAIVLTLDSLRAQFLRLDYAKAESTMSDLGHYVADATQPLHCTQNYDGYLTGNSGIHSRYETGMVSAFQAQLAISPDSARYILSPLDYAFELIFRSQELVDSIMAGDDYAKAVSLWSGSGTPPPEYYAALWEKTGQFTRERFQTATIAIASLWFTAWTDAEAVTPVEPDVKYFAGEFSLEQNYPNPFNPSTKLKFRIPETGSVTVKVYDLLGAEVATIMNGILYAGTHISEWDARNHSSGLYFCRLDFTTPAGTIISDIKHMALIK